MIRLEAVGKVFGGRQAVDAISLAVQPGEIFGLVGPDGAGKTTTIRMMTGVMTPSAGRITVLGEQDMERVKAHIGYVPQRFSLYGDLTVMENIRLMGALYGSSGREIELLAKDILAMTQLLPFKERLAANLSGGMKQKLALAAGLMHQPKLLFLDEPTTGVDPVSRREFWQVLYRLNQTGTTVFVSTPYMDEAELCSRIAFMHNGSLTAVGTPQQLKEQYPYRIIELETNSKALKRQLAGVAIRDINSFGDKYHIVVDEYETVAAAIKQVLNSAGILILAMREVKPVLEDVFVSLAGEGGS